MTASDALISWDTEHALLRKAVHDSRSGHASVVQVIGPPGCGRRSLIRSAMAFARQAGMRVLYAKAPPPEAETRNGVLVELLTVLSPARVWDLTSAHAPAATFCGEFLRATGESPLALVVEDAQWCDEYSIEWLSALVHRMGHTPMLVVLGAVPLGLPAERALAALSMRAGATGLSWHVVEPQPFSPAATRQLLDSVAETTPDNAFVDAVQRYTRGLPSFLRVTAEAVARREFGVAAADLPALDSWAATEFGDRDAALLQVLPEPLLAMLRAIVVSHGFLDTDLLARLAETKGPAPADAVDRLRKLGLATPGDPPRPGQPWTRGRVLVQMTGPERERLRARAALLGYEAAVPAAGLARILLDAPVIGEPWAVHVLREAAEHCDAESRAEEAVGYLRRAAQEPIEVVDRTRLELMMASVGVRHAPDASDRMLARIATGPGPAEVAPLRVEAADLLLARGNVETTEQTIAVAIARPEITDRVRTRLGALHWLALDGTYESESPVSGVPPLPCDPADPAAASALAWQLARSGRDACRARELARSVLAAGFGEGDPLSPQMVASRVLITTDDVLDAEAGLDEVLRVAQHRRAHAAVAWTRLIWSILHGRQGRLAEANDEFDRALDELPLEHWHPTAKPKVLAHKMGLQLESGLLDHAERLAGVEPSGGAESSIGWAQFMLVKGLLLLRTGRPAEAADRILEAGRLLLARGWTNPAMYAWRSFAANAYYACGDDREAARLVAEELELARKWGVSSTVGGTHLNAAMTLSRPCRLYHLEAAARLLRRSPLKIRYATALLGLAEERHAAGQHEGLAALVDEGGALAWRLGSRALVERAEVLGWQAARPDARALAKAFPVRGDLR